MYIKWDEDEKARILAEAKRLLREQPRLSKEDALRGGQLVLDEDRRRKISSINTPAFDWFHTGVLVAESAPPPPPEAPPEAPPEPEPEPVDNATLLRILDIVLGIDRKFETKKFEERLTELEKQVRRIRRVIEGGFTLVPTESVNREQAAAPPPPTVTATPGTRKPNVVVLSVPSGNTQGGIKKGTAGYVGKLDFWDTPRRPVSFDSYDYVVVTKFTKPTEVVTDLKARIANGKLRISTGNAEEISRFIRTLPEIPTK
jgi:hypothetical protein